MPVTRFVPREKRRLSVSLNGHADDLTAEVSAHGFAVSLFNVLQTGTPVSGELTLGAQTFPFEGEVAWSHLGDPRLSFVGRMGIRFTSVSDAFFLALRG